MNHNVDPYTPPGIAEVSSPEPEMEGSWKVANGHLWVRDGAILPDICLYGSATGRRTPIKLLWLPRAANVLNWILALLGTFLLLGYSWMMRPELSGMLRAILIAALVSSAIQAVAFKKNWKRYKITIQRSKGWKAILRVAAVVCLFFALFNFAMVGLDHYLEFAGYDPKQKIGIVNSLFFLWMTSTHAVILLQMVRAVEVRDGWHRLAGVHPKTLGKLLLLQGDAPWSARTISTTE
jgi:hypothetical protein